MAGVIFLSPLTALAWDKNNPESLRGYVVYVASHEDVSADLVFGIINGESSWNYRAKNSSSTASGLLQYLDSTFKTYCVDKYKMAESLEQKNNPFIQINCAIEMLKEPKGYLHWLPSIASWGHLL